MTSATRLVPLAAGTLVLLAGPALAHPIVAGFERFHGGPESDPAAGGRLLLGELNCVSCHAADGQSKKQAPVLDGIGTRARVSYLRKYIADPHATKPGTTMPALFAGDADKDAKVEALVHFLATTGTPAQSRSDFKAVLRGRDTFAKVGCAACHGPRDLSAEPSRNQFGFAVPLGNLKDKYSVPGLSAFLANPLASRPAGRMPHLLKPGEALDVAQYLLQGVKVSLPNGKGTTTYSYYEGGWDRLPNLDKEKPAARGKGIAFEIGMAKRRGDFAFRFEGYFRAEAAGEYRFHLSSDDGSRLLIDGRKVVDNDGIHATETKTGAIELTKGVHQIVVEYFQGNGEVSLEVEIEGRGLGRQPLAPHVAATEADLDRKVVTKVALDEDSLAVRPELVEKGKALFASAGCASCHQINVDKKPLAATNAAPAFAGLKAAAGCLAESPRPGLPRYDLNGAQRKALSAAIAKPQAASADLKTVIHQAMVTFNCYACHARDNVGGPTPATNALFATTTPEMGDEGRVPPPLDGVGAKLNAAYMRQILDKGADDRPYMHTRMPGFGLANVGHLTEAFESLDKLSSVPPVKFAESELKVVSAGRYMVGAQAFGCNKCHTFAGNKAEGVQGIDMLLMPKRLKRDWFHAYCIDPQKTRPGTRMPTAWPMGQSTLPSVLNGEAATQVEAIWAYLNSKNPQIPAGMGRKFMPLVPSGEAIIYRNFIQGAGTRAIGVGYPEKLNLAFDANDLRLAMVWKGGFIDSARHWTDRGAGFEGPLGDEVITFPAGPAFAILAKSDAAWPSGSARDIGSKFLGYSTAKDERPTFRYAASGVTIEDFPNPSGKDNPTLRRTFSMSADGPVDDLYFRAAVGSKVERVGDGWFKVDGYRVRIDGAEPVVRQSGGKSELLVPIRVAGGKAKFVQELAW
jgi:mono/diheme cytochrome c family protein